MKIEPLQLNRGSCRDIIISSEVMEMENEMTGRELTNLILQLRADGKTDTEVVEWLLKMVSTK